MIGLIGSQMESGLLEWWACLCLQCNFYSLVFASLRSEHGHCRRSHRVFPTRSKDVLLFVRRIHYRPHRGLFCPKETSTTCYECTSEHAALLQRSDKKRSWAMLVGKGCADFPVWIYGVVTCSVRSSFFLSAFQAYGKASNSDRASVQVYFWPATEIGEIVGRTAPRRDHPEDSSGFRERLVVDSARSLLQNGIAEML